jgi:hypothetical protein
MARIEKVDLYRPRKDEYIASKRPTLVDTKPAKYLFLSGKGAPGGPVFTAKVCALYRVALGLRARKKALDQDYPIGKLEGFWSGDSEDFIHEDPETWNWKILIRIPESIRDRELAEVTKTVKEKGKGGPEVASVGLEVLNEGLCVQVLHVGPYFRESETVKQMAEFASDRGLSFHGYHHEIYLSHPGRVPAERLRTILRHHIH